MIIKNIGTKIINIGTEILVPDKEIEVSRGVAELPAIKAFEEKGYIKVVDNEKKASADEKPETAAPKATGKRNLKRTTSASEEN